MERILTTDDHLSMDDHKANVLNPLLNSLSKPLKSNFFDKLSNAQDDGIGCVNKNDENKSTEKSSRMQVDTENACENDVSPVSCAKYEVLENGYDSSIAEKNPNSTNDFEKVEINADSSLEPMVTDDLSKKENVCCSHNGETNLVNSKILDIDDRNNFVPTIVEIRGGSSNIFEQADQSSSSSLHHDVSSFMPPEDDTFIGDISLSQEQSTIVTDESVHSGTEYCNINFSNEFPKNEKKTEIDDPIKICNETGAKLSSPILMNVESKEEPVSQLGSNQTEKNITTKRFTRSSLSKSNDCISVSDAKKRKQPSKNAPCPSAVYSCHLCNSEFQENEQLNMHMIQHRDNNLVKKKVQNRSKPTKPKQYTCDICKKELSSSQSLQQHVLIHKNVKPFVCHVCQKDFRHLSNYRMHLQKHKAEQCHGDEMQQTENREQFEESVVGNVKSGRLVGPLSMKENQLYPELDTTSDRRRSLRSAASSSAEKSKQTTSKTFNSTQKSPPCEPHLSSDRRPLKIKENTTSTSSAVIIKRQVPSSVSIGEEKCGTVKNFKNIESVVMNASKTTVKLDDFDTRVLKRKLLTPNISIDQPPNKCRVQLSPIAGKYNLKLDEIENIPMYVDPSERYLPSVELKEDDQVDEYLTQNNGMETTGVVYPPLSDNELFTLLNDDRNTSTATAISVNSADDDCYVDAEVAISPDISQLNVIVGETTPSYDMSFFEDDRAVDDQLVDVFDAAFQKVATRRLVLLQKRAAENCGKIERRYLLGPLFWCKALRRATTRVNAVSASSNGNTDSDMVYEDSCNGGHLGDFPKMCSDLVQCGDHSWFDDRQTNDPVELQSRAESKFECLLKRAKRVTNLNSLNLGGPFFWRRTLQLAGVHCGEDLRIHMNFALPALEEVEFVTDDETPCDYGTELVNAELQKTPELSPSHFVSADCASPSRSNDQLPSDAMSSSIASGIKENVLELSEQILSSVAPIDHQHSVIDDLTLKDAVNVSPKTFNILVENSLTELRENQLQPIQSDNLPSSDVHCGSVLIDNLDNTMASSLCHNSETEVLQNFSADMLYDEHNKLNGDAAVAVKDDDRLVDELDINDSGSILLNLDGDKSSQLIPMSNDLLAFPEAGQNFVLVSDESGTMQYLVNVTNENHTNFGLLGASGCEEPVAYALQFDGENYIAVQFVQDGDGIQLHTNDGLKEALQVDSEPATYLVSTPGAATSEVVSDPDHIGSELSDFLNLDYCNLLKNGVAN